MDQNKKRIFIQKIDELPTLPTSLLKIIEVIENRESSAQDLANVISRDQSISSVILRLVNSAFYGHLRQISSMSHAVVILGYQTVKTMALGVSVFQTSPHGHSPFNRGDFWVHSIGVATIAKRIASLSSRPVDPDTAFLAGLLHDIGKVIFDNYFFDDYAKAVKTAFKRNVWVGSLEQEMMGMTHAEGGYHLARKWQFPPEVIDAIRYHHKIVDAPIGSIPISAVVHVADILCRQIRLGTAGDEVNLIIDPSTHKVLGLDADQLSDLALALDAERESIEEFSL